MSREQDAKIAEWMGWQWCKWKTYHAPENAWGAEMICVEYRKLFAPDEVDEYELADGSELIFDWYFDETGGGNWPRFSSDLNAMAQALKVVKERGLGDEFTFVLLEIVTGITMADRCLHWGKWCVSGADLEKFATATAPQQADALCRMIDGEAK